MLGISGATSGNRKSWGSEYLSCWRYLELPGATPGVTWGYSWGCLGLLGATWRYQYLCNLAMPVPRISGYSQYLCNPAIPGSPNLGLPGATSENQSSILHTYPSKGAVTYGCCYIPVSGTYVWGHIFGDVFVALGSRLFGDILLDSAQHNLTRFSEF